MRLINYLAAFVVTLFLIMPASADAQGRQPNPFPADYPYALAGNLARHHIIPMEELVRYGVGEYGTEEELTDFLNNYHGFNNANLGAYTGNINLLVEDYFDDVPAATESVFQLFAWMQGNLVVGPNNQARTNDPGQAFDAPALNCRQRHAYNANYNNLEGRWNGTPLQELGVFELLSTTPISPLATAVNAAAIPGRPQCQW